MSRRGGWRWALALVTGALVTGLNAACGMVLGLDRFDRGDGSECWSKNAQGVACFKCDPKVEVELLNACTTRVGYPFDDRARIGDPEAGRPALPGVVDTSEMPQPPAGTATKLCRELTDHVYVVGSTAFKANGTLGKFANAIAGARIASFVYQEMRSCVGFDRVIGREKLYGVADYWAVPKAGAAPESGKCQFAVDVNEAADIGLTDVRGDRCSKGFVATPDIGVAYGPVQVFSFVTNARSTQEVLSAEAAYRIYGWAGGLGPPPWNEPTLVLKRNKWSGTQSALGGFIGLDAELWQGVSMPSGDDMLVALKSASQPERVIGILSGDIVDSLTDRSDLRLLAYQHTAQNLGFLPDSDRGSWDRRNVRDGHYALWQPLHMYTRYPGGVVPPPTMRVLAVLDGTKPIESFDDVGALKGGGLVPRCAMRVAHDEDGKLVPYRPESKCQCEFDAAAPSSGAACASCAGGAACPAGTTCAKGKYCEPN